ncbi:bestrophin-like domain [Nocardioides sp. P5_C9_2]
MDLVRTTVLVAVLCAGSVATMMLARRWAPAGSRFQDGDRASGVFGSLATGFSVLLGFMIFLGFSSYDTSLSGAEDEATLVAQQVETAQFLPADVGPDLTGQLVCYARSVVATEWDALSAGTMTTATNPWGVELYRTIQTVEPRSDTAQSAYDRWMDQTVQRQQARGDRIHGAEGILPTPLWVVLYIAAAVIFVFMLFFADPAEGVLPQAMLMGSVTVVLAFSMLLLNFFDSPFDEGAGQLRPTAMERSLELIDAEMALVGIDVTPPCDDRGRAR